MRSGVTVPRCRPCSKRNVELQIAPCRRVDGVSCPDNGVVPPTVVELVQSLGSQLGPYVVVEVGYNEPQDEFGQDVENALAAFQPPASSTSGGSICARPLAPIPS